MLRATGDLVSAISVRSTSRTPLWSMALGFRKHALRDALVDRFDQSGDRRLDIYEFNAAPIYRTYLSIERG